MSHQSRFAEQQRSQADEEGRSGMMDWATNTVEEQPVSAVCSAFGVGFLLGMGAVAVYCAMETQSNSYSADRLTERISDAISRSIPDRLSKFAGMS